LGGEAKLAIDGATNLGGDADGMPIVLRHEDAFDGAAIGGKFEEIAHGAVGGVEALVDSEASVRGFGAKAVAEILGEGSCFVQIRNVALIQRIINLPSPKGTSARPEQVEQVGDFEAEERRLHTGSHLHQDSVG